MWLVGGMLEPIFNNSLWQIRLTTRLLTVSWEQCHYTTITVWSWRCWRLKMMHLTIAALSVFMFLQVASGQTPPRPNLSNSFSAEVHVNVHSFSHKNMLPCLCRLCFRLLTHCLINKLLPSVTEYTRMSKLHEIFIENLWYMVVSMHKCLCNVVLLVWGSFRLAPITKFAILYACIIILC